MWASTSKPQIIGYILEYYVRALQYNSLFDIFQ